MTFSEKNCNTCGQKCAIKYHGCSNWIPMQSEWIPISERLPEKNTWVLTCYRLGNNKIDIDIKRINRWNNQWEDEFDYCNTVIAWMPLPAPYEP